jgi:hypothetical protein
MTRPTLPILAPSPLVAACWLVAGCASSPPEACDTTAADVPAQCQTKVHIGLYSDDTCTAGKEVLTVVLDLTLECGQWSRSTGTGTRYDSATRFQCYRDRLCYTQYPGAQCCDAGVESEDKESRTTCLKDPTPGIWTKILSGTESCPDAPDGFECPNHARGTVTTSVLACHGA